MGWKQYLKVVLETFLKKNIHRKHMKELYVMKRGNGKEYYMIPVRNIPPFEEIRFKDAEILRLPTGVGPVIFARLIPEKMANPLCTVIISRNDLMFVKMMNAEGLSTSFTSYTIATFNNVDLTVEKDRIEIKGEEELRGQSIVNGKESMIGVEMKLVLSDFIELELAEKIGETSISYKVKEKVEKEKNGMYAGPTVMVILSDELTQKIEEALAGRN
jgi:hypothetical protein